MRYNDFKLAVHPYIEMEIQFDTCTHTAHKLIIFGKSIACRSGNWQQDCLFFFYYYYFCKKLPPGVINRKTKIVPEQIIVQTEFNRIGQNSIELPAYMQRALKSHWNSNQKKKNLEICRDTRFSLYSDCTPVGLFLIYMPSCVPNQNYFPVISLFAWATSWRQKLQMEITICADGEMHIYEQCWMH